MSSQHEANGLAAVMVRHGFVPAVVGPVNTPAYVREDGDIIEVIHRPDVTDPRPACEAADVVLVSTRAAGGPADREPTRTTLGEVVRALTHPSDEYALLDLRLHVGLGRAVGR